jgi:hypothetical protein
MLGGGWTVFGSKIVVSEKETIVNPMLRLEYFHLIQRGPEKCIHTSMYNISA